MTEPRLCTWRVGRSIGRTIYAMVGPEPSKADYVIGMLDSDALAAEVVAAHNAHLRGGKSFVDVLRADDARRLVGREITRVDREVDEDGERLVFEVAGGTLVLRAVRDLPGALVALWTEV